jgi:hypothetical protein
MKGADLTVTHPAVAPPRRISHDAPASASVDSRQYRFGFVMDQQVGLRTHAMNLERVTGEHSDIGSLFVPVRYEADAGPLARLPILPGGVRGTLRGVREIRDGLRSQRLDSVLWATWAAKSVPDLVAAAPAVLVMDMTPTQMEAMGAHYNYTSSRARLLGGWKRRATDRLYRTAQHFYPWSRYVADSLIGEYGVPAEKVTVVSPGVDLDLYRTVTEPKSDADVVRLLFVGGDLVRKGGDLLLRWFQEWGERQGNTRVELHLVTRDTPSGPLPNGVYLHQGISNNSTELVRLYQSCDLFVLPTRADCYSLVAMEAMACGLPVIISRLGGIPDIVVEGETGYLLPAGEAEPLSAALERLIIDPDLRQRMGKAGRRRAEAEFDCRRNIGRVLAGMRAVAGGEGPK